jgi:hypothetical protein
MRIGLKNIAFIREFLAVEGIPVVAERLGGNQGLIIRCQPHIFEVLVKPVAVERFRVTGTEELSYREKITRDLLQTGEENITLF